MTDQIGTVRVAVKADTSEFERSSKRVKTEADKLDKTLAKTAGSAKKITPAMRNASRETNALAKSFQSAAASAAFVTGPLGGVASRITLMSQALKSGFAGVLALSLALTGLAIVIKKSIEAARVMETAMLKTEAVLKATGNASGFTAEQIRIMAREIGLATLASTQGVERAAQKLMTFRAVQGKVFRDALVLSQDLAELGFGPIEAGAVQLGKALEDPVNGLQSLRRVGATFSVSQRKVIKDLVETNRVAEAQTMIIKILNEQVGGAGVAAAQGLDGAYDTLNQRLTEFLENIGNSGPLSVWTSLINGMARALNNWNNEIFKSDFSKLQELVDRRTELLNQPKDMFSIGGSGTRDKAEIDTINKQISAIQNRQVARQKGEKAAADAAVTAKLLADKERDEAAALALSEEASKKAAKAAEQLANQRAQAIGGLKTEISILQTLSGMYIENQSSMEDMEKTRESLKLVADLQFQAGSKEAAQIAELVSARYDLAAALDAETEKRKTLEDMQKSFEGNIQGVSNRTVDLQAEIDSFNMAAAAAEAYKIEQKLINDAIADFGTLSEAQMAQIRGVASAYGTAAAAMDELRKKREEAEEQARMAAESELRLQETLAEGLTSAILNAKDAGDAFNALALEIAKAVIQAEMLALIQQGLGTPSSSKGGGGSALVGLFTQVAGMFAGGGGAATTAGAAVTAGGISSVMASRMHTGGIGGKDGMRMNAPASMFINAPKFHNGLKADEFPAILQKGEKVTPKDQVGGEARVNNYNFNIKTNDADSFRKSQRQIGREIRGNVSND